MQDEENELNKKLVGENPELKDDTAKLFNFVKKEKKRLRKEKFGRSAKNAFDLVALVIRTSIGIITPIFSAISIWVSVIGIAFTLFSGVEPFIAVAHWARFLTIKWRALTHHAWDIVSPYVGFQIPIDLKDFATFMFMIALALGAGLFSRGKRLVIYEAVVGIRMAIYGISHAIGPTRQADPEINIASRTQLLFFEINEFLSKYFRSFFIYSLPILAIMNIAFRVAIVLIPMIILVPESAFEEHLGVRASRVEYIVVSAVLSYSAAIVILLSGAAHLIVHFFRAIIVFFALKIVSLGISSSTGELERLQSAFADAKFGLTYQSIDPVRKLWDRQPFLTRLSATMIRSNWVWWPVSKSEKFHRRYDPFLKLSERRYADAAFIDRIAKGLFLFFIIYALNWVSINSEDILNMFEPPNVTP